MKKRVCLSIVVTFMSLSSIALAAGSGVYASAQTTQSNASQVRATMFLIKHAEDTSHTTDKSQDNTQTSNNTENNQDVVVHSLINPGDSNEQVPGRAYMK